jgi:hypothetical protein
VRSFYDFFLYFTPLEFGKNSPLPIRGVLLSLNGGADLLRRPQNLFSA